MDLMQLPDELDLADLEAENEKLEQEKIDKAKADEEKRLQEEFEGDGGSSYESGSDSED